MNNEFENIRECIHTLMENFIVFRKDYPNEFKMIQKNEKKIKQFLIDSFGYRLISDSDSYKVEKIPKRAHSWMGIDEFKRPIDYMFFVSLLSIFENMAHEDRFVVSKLSEDVQSFLNESDPIIYNVDWKERSNRESFVRALRFAEKSQLIKLLDGNVNEFEKSEQDYAALYKVNLSSRHFLRHLVKPIKDYESIQSLLDDQLDQENIKHRIYRLMYFEPVVYQDELTDDEYKYLELYNRDRKLQDDFSDHTLFQLEQYRSGWIKVLDERKQGIQQHPSTKGVSEIVLHFSHTVYHHVKRRNLQNESFLDLSYSEYLNLVNECIERFKVGWWKKYRQESTTETIALELLDYLEDWKMAEYDATSYSVTLFPTIARMVGDYSKSFWDEIDNKQNKGE